MTLPTSYTAADLARMEQALASGELVVEVELGGERQRVEYRSVDQLLKAIAYVRGQLSCGAGEGATPSTYAQFERC
ncbi:MAG: hypothetical protein AB1592_15785 [Pseudomonadota bacterium]